MSTRRLVLLMVLAGAAIALWLGLQSRGETQQGAQRGPLFAAGELPLEQVNRIELERPGSPTMVFERTTAGWTQTAPYQHPGDAAALREVIDVAAGLEQSRAVDLDSLDPAARGALGLEPPQAVLRLAWPGGDRALELGRLTVAGRAWMRVRGRQQAASVDASLHALAVQGDPRQWRSVALFDPTLGEAERITLNYGNAGAAAFVLQRQGSEWRLTAPCNTRADADAVRGYIEAISRAQADAFAADQPSDYAAFGLAKPTLRVEIARSGGAPSGTIDVGQAVAQGALERFGRIDGRPAVLQIGAKAMAALFPPPAFFVDPRGTDAVPADVRRIEFASALAPGKAIYALERLREGWVLRSAAADAAPANAEAVRRLLTQLAQTRGFAVSFSAMPAETLLGEFTLYGEGDAQLAHLRVGREANDGKWALDDGSGVLRVFPPGFDLRLEPGAYAGTR